MEKDPQQLREELGSAKEKRKKALKNLETDLNTESFKSFKKAETNFLQIRSELIESLQKQNSCLRYDLNTLENKNQQIQERMKNMEDELQRKKYALTQKDEELNSFKDRLAGDIASSIKTGKAVNLNNPVSQPRIKELYNDLRRNWPKIKKNLKSKQAQLESHQVRNEIQKMFEKAKNDMKQRINLMDDIFGLSTAENDAAPSKVKYKLLAVQNLQLAIYSDKEESLKNPTQQRPFETFEEELNNLHYHCYWLGCLMALNDPPLEPDWMKPSSTCDPWDILPEMIITQHTVHYSTLTSV